MKILLVIVFFFFTTCLSAQKLLYALKPGEDCVLSEYSTSDLQSKTGKTLTKGTWYGNAPDAIWGILTEAYNYLTAGTLILHWSGHHLIHINDQILGFENQITIDFPYGNYTYFLAKDNFSEWKGPYNVNIKILRDTEIYRTD